MRRRFYRRNTMTITRRQLLKLIPASTLVALSAACGRRNKPLPTLTPTPPAPSPEPVARAFLEAWEADDFNTMYALLFHETRTALSRDQFEAVYRAVFREARIYAFETELVAAGRLSVDQAGADFDVTYRTRLTGALTFRPRLWMRLEEGDWRITWTPAAIMPELDEENVLKLFPRVPPRGVIYAQQRTILATHGVIVTVGVVPGQIQDEAALLATLSNLLGIPPQEIAAKYAEQPPDWFVPVGLISAETAQANYDTLARIPGVELRERAARAYPQGERAAHVVGYVGPISAEELVSLAEQGYDENDLVGKLGVEQAAEPILAGRKGGRLVVLSPEGQEVKTLADVPARQSRNLHTTLDMALQQVAEDLLGERKGAVVVLEVSTGRVLALASYPRFDPNAMANLLNPQQRLAIAQQPDHPLVNRATQGVYPCGSVFKIVTMTAALETGLFTPQSTFFCSGVWTRLGIPMTCWKRSGHGNIDLFNGLVESCDVVFYEVGLALYNRDPNLLQTFARRLGFGAPTGIEVAEAAGLVPDDAWKRAQVGVGWTPGDTVNMAIGQGFLLVTPLQVARMMATVANGGTLFRPTLFDMAEDVANSANTERFQPETTGTLGVREDVLQTLQGALSRVTQPPRGTASFVFRNFPLPVAGKTGTAEAPGPGGEPHAWFAAYAPADRPQIAVVAMMENAGEGSSVAAPVVRDLLAAYFGLNRDLEARSVPTPARV